MLNVATLTELIEANRAVAGALSYLEGERESRSVSFNRLLKNPLIRAN